MGKGVGLKTVELLFSKGIKSEMDLVRYVRTHTEKEFLIDFKRYRYRKKLAKIFYSRSFYKERLKLFDMARYEKSIERNIAGKEMMKKQKEDSRKKNEESSTTSTSNDKPEESDLNDIKGVGLKTVE